MKVILDAQLLVLLVVGATSLEYIGKHKRLRAYGISDYFLLTQRLRPPVETVVTPNVLTEASNIAGQINEPARRSILAVLARTIGIATERFIPSDAAARHPEFLRLGLSDAALLTGMSADDVLLTADVDLYVAASHRGIRVENFNHIRGL